MRKSLRRNDEFSASGLSKQRDLVARAWGRVTQYLVPEVDVGVALKTVNRFYEATDRREVERLGEMVATNVTFIGPMMQAAGADEYLQMNARLLPFHRETRMLARFEREQDVCSLYEMDLETPAGEPITLTMADWIRLDAGKIAEQRIFFDPRAFAAGFGLGDGPAPTR